MQVKFQDKTYSFPLAEFKELFPTSFLLDSLDATGVIPLTHPEMTSNLLSSIEIFLNTGDVDALTHLSPAEVKVAHGYLGMTLVAVIFGLAQPEYRTFCAGVNPKWFRHAYVKEHYYSTLSSAVHRVYLPLIQYIFEQMPPELTVDADQKVFGRSTGLLGNPQMLRMILRRHININSFNGIIYYNLVYDRVDPEIFKMILADERFDAKKYGPLLWKLVNAKMKEAHAREKFDIQMYTYQSILASHPKTAEFMFDD